MKIPYALEKEIDRDGSFFQNGITESVFQSPLQIPLWKRTGKRKEMGMNKVFWNVYAIMRP